MKVQSKHPSPYHHNSDESQKVCEFATPRDEDAPWENGPAEYCWEPATIARTTSHERNMQDGYDTHRSYYCETHAKQIVHLSRTQGNTIWSNEWAKLKAVQ